MVPGLGCCYERSDHDFKEIWALGVWVRKAVEFFNFCLMVHTSRHIEDSGAKSDLNFGETGLTGL